MDRNRRFGGRDNRRRHHTEQEPIPVEIADQILPEISEAMVTYLDSQDVGEGDQKKIVRLFKICSERVTDELPRDEFNDAFAPLRNKLVGGADEIDEGSELKSQIFHVGIALVCAARITYLGLKNLIKKSPAKKKAQLEKKAVDYKTAGEYLERVFLSALGMFNTRDVKEATRVFKALADLCTLTFLKPEEVSEPLDHLREITSLAESKIPLLENRKPDALRTTQLKIRGAIAIIRDIYPEARPRKKDVVPDKPKPEKAKNLSSVFAGLGTKAVGASKSPKKVETPDEVDEEDEDEDDDDTIVASEKSSKKVETPDEVDEEDEDEDEDDDDDSVPADKVAAQQEKAPSRRKETPTKRPARKTKYTAKQIIAAIYNDPNEAVGKAWEYVDQENGEVDTEALIETFTDDDGEAVSGFEKIVKMCRNMK